MVTINEIFENPKIKGIKGEELSLIKGFSEEQKIALIKSVLYIISADNIITEEEKRFFYLLCSELGVTNDIIEKATELSDDKMFEVLQSVTDEQEAYIIACLNNAAHADNSLAIEEQKLIEMFSVQIQSGKKPVAFYNKILTF